MAVYRLSVSVISRGDGGRSALASAAYRAAEKLAEIGRDALTSVLGSAAYRSGSELSADSGAVFDFSSKRGVVHSEIMAPENAPVWMNDRERLWNAVEAVERRVNARLARETQLALPRELDREARIALARGFIAERMVARGMVADFAIHDVEARDGGRQPHCHVMTTTRAVDPTKPLGFGAKVREWDDRGLVVEWREAWAGHVNAALERAAVAERVDHRTLEARRREAAAAGNFAKAAELDREPEPKVGFEAWALERDGIRTDRGDLLREVQERNAGRREVYERVAEHGPEAQARFLEVRERTGDALQAFIEWGEQTLEHAMAWARGAMVAAGIGAAALGLLPERDSFQPSESAVTVTEPTIEDDEDMMRIIEQMDTEGNARAVQLTEPGDPEASLTVRESAIIDAYVATFPELPDPAVIEEIEAQAAADPETREAKATDASEIGPKEEAGIAAIERDDAEPEAEVEDAEMAELLDEMDREAEIEREEQGLEIGD
jgi:MobA/MobL family